MKIYKYPTRQEWPELTRRPEADAGALEDSVRNILQEVKLSGDTALKTFTLQFDKAGIDKLQVEPEAFLHAEQRLNPCFIKLQRKFFQCSVTTQLHFLQNIKQ